MTKVAMAESFPRKSSLWLRMRRRTVVRSVLRTTWKGVLYRLRESLTQLKRVNAVTVWKNEMER